MAAPSREELALKEIEILEEIIGRYESHFHQVRGWLMVVVGALVAGLYADGIRLPWGSFLFAGSIAVLLFFVWESSLHSVHRAAIERVTELEPVLRGDATSANVTMCQITNRLGSARWSVGFKDMWTVHFHWMPYAAIAVVVVFVGATAPVVAEKPAAPPGPTVVQYFTQPATAAPMAAPVKDPAPAKADVAVIGTAASAPVKQAPTTAEKP